MHLQCQRIRQPRDALNRDLVVVIVTPVGGPTTTSNQSENVHQSQATAGLLVYLRAETRSPPALVDVLLDA
jgi:hypothetical protein